MYKKNGYLSQTWNNKKQQWNIPTDRSQDVDQKTEVICLLIKFAPAIIVKMSKMAHSFYFLLMAAKNQSHGFRTFLLTQQIFQYFYL